MKGIINVLCVSACVAMLFVGCAKKPKINLANLRDNTANASNVPGGGAEFDPNSFVPGEGQPAIPGLNEGGNGAADANAATAAPAGWTAMNKAVDAGAGANEYIN